MKKRVRTLIFLAVFILCAAGTAGLSSAEPENTAPAEETADPASDNCLSSLRIAQAILSPEFSPEQLTYTATVPYDVTRIALTADTRSGQAKKVISGTGDLAVGENTVTIAVTAQDGSVREYRVTVIREETEGGESSSFEETTEQASSEETESEPVTESSEEQPATESEAQTTALTQTEEPAETPAQTEEPAQTSPQTEEAVETTAVLQTEDSSETTAPGGFQTAASSQKKGDGRLFGMNPLLLILGAVSLLLLFVIIAVFLLRREIDGEDDEEEEFDEDEEVGEEEDVRRGEYDREEPAARERGAKPTGSDDRDIERESRSRSAKPSEHDRRTKPAAPAKSGGESRKPAGSRNTGLDRGGNAREQNGDVHSSGKPKSAGKDADAAGMVTPEELARFYHALNLEEEVMPSASSRSVSGDLDEDLEILDLEEEMVSDVSRSELEKDDDFDFLDL